MMLLRDGAIAGWTLGEIGTPAGGRVSDGIGSRYPDEGCEYAPRCLSCPLPACRYDLPPKLAGALMRRAQLGALQADGLSVDACAAALGVSVRAVYRLRHVPAPAALPVMG